MDYSTMKGLLDDPAAKTKITLKEGDKSITMERTPSENSMTANGLLGGMIGGISPSPVADDKQINVTSGEFVVNKPAAQKYAGLLEDINNEGREMLAAGGYTGESMVDGYAKGGKLGEKISKIYNEGYTAPGQAYAIAKNMGYAEGGLIGDVQSDAETIMMHPVFKKLVKQSMDYGYDPAEVPSHILSSNIGQFFDTPEKVEALHVANAMSQSMGYKYGGKVNYANGGEVDGVVSRYLSGELAGNQAIEALRNLGMSGEEAIAYLKKSSETPAAIVADTEYVDTDADPATAPAVGYGEGKVDPRLAGEVGLGNPNVGAPVHTSSPVDTPQALEGPGGVLDNRSFDYILEKSRGLSAGKGFGGAKLGAREYVDSLYAPEPGAATGAAAGSAAGPKYGRSANLRWRDENGVEQTRAGRQIDGEWHLENENGEWVPASQVAGTTDIQVASRTAEPALEEGPGGIPNATSYNEATGIPSFEFARESESKAYGYTIRAIAADSELSQLETQIPPQKISDLYGGLAQWAARNANGKVTAAVLNDILGDSGLQQYSREMTKFLQAILRNDTGAAYTGTEIADYLSAFGIAPGTVVNEEVLRSFQDGRRQEIATSIARTGKAAPYLSGLLAGEYPLPGLGSITAEGKEADKPAGVDIVL